MTLPSSGTLTLEMIAEEFEGTKPYKLSDYYGVDTNIPTSGTIKISDFYGASAKVLPTINYIGTFSSATAEQANGYFDITISSFRDDRIVVVHNGRQLSSAIQNGRPTLNGKAHDYFRGRTSGQDQSFIAAWIAPQSGTLRFQDSTGLRYNGYFVYEILGWRDFEEINNYIYSRDPGTAWSFSVGNVNKWDIGFGVWGTNEDGGASTKYLSTTYDSIKYFDGNERDGGTQYELYQADTVGMSNSASVGGYRLSMAHVVYRQKSPPKVTPQYTVTLTASEKNVNIFTKAKALGWNGTTVTDIGVVVNSGVIISTSSLATPAMDTGAMPAGCKVRIENHGHIAGAGGKGGSNDTTLATPGGIAIKTNCYVEIHNSGYIFGGGGGGQGTYASGASAAGGGGAGDIVGPGGTGVGGPSGSPGTFLAGGKSGDNYLGGSGLGVPGQSGSYDTGHGGGGGGARGGADTTFLSYAAAGNAISSTFTGGVKYNIKSGLSNIYGPIG